MSTRKSKDILKQRLRSQVHYNDVKINGSYIVFVLENVLGVDASKTRQRTVDKNHADAKDSDVYHTGRHDTRL